MFNKGCEKKKGLTKRIFNILGKIFLFFLFMFGMCSAIYDCYLLYKLHNGTISVSEKKYLDNETKLAKSLDY